ncbi:FixH family protein [Streptomyces sp. NBC_00243]|uniref:transferase n=1 Tax=Streptomyces sp. NBC_00243 TaxID=2975688 RepID=UPI002DDC240D|nr:transferase [Streptomyces sp. NBC_00243]WRZ22710.1 FixH family protein [Streptomyces sp. NBC_00243]
MSAERATELRAAELRADCTADAHGRITFGLRLDSAVHPQLLLRLRPKKGQPEQVVHLIDLEPDEDGRRRAVLDPEPALAEGRWDVYLLREPGEERLRLRPGLRDQRTLVDGHTRDRSSPVAVRIPYATKDGYLAVRAWLRTAHSEAGAIDVTDRSMTVAARLHGASLGEGAAVLLRRRGEAGVVQTLEPRAGGDGRDFSFTVDHQELAAAGGTGSGSGIWDVFLQPAAGAPRIRVGRLLDDLADRKEIFVYPAATVGGVTLRPYYTVDNDLSVAVTRTPS